MAAARVLLVDDDRLFIRRMQRALDGSVELQVVTTSSDALTTVTAWVPDVVVMDPLLGDADSFGLLDLLGGDGWGTDVGVICLSKGPGAVTRFQSEAGRFFGVVMRDAGTDGVCRALRFALGGAATVCDAAV